MNLTPEMILRGYQANTAALEEMIFAKGKVAIVTGGTSGLGFCVARRLCQGGAKVVLASSTQEKGDLAVRLLKEEGFDTVFCKTDVRNEEEVKHLISFTAETYGSIDILVTAAGIWSFAHIEDLEEDVFKNTLDVNLLGAYRCAKHVSRYMIDHKIKGKMLLVSSNSAYLPQPVFGGYAHYTASKGGVKARDWEAFLGPNAGYYLMNFKRMAVTGQKLAVSFSAFFFGPFYFFYRKMWVPAAIFLTLDVFGAYIPQLLQFLVLAESPLVAGLNLEVFSTVLNVLRVVNLAIQFTEGLFAVYWYRRIGEKRIARTLQSCTAADAPAALAKAGGVSVTALVVSFSVVLGIYLLLSFMALAPLMAAPMAGLAV